MKKNYTILAIESSCDDTSVAVVRDGRQVLSCVISSQIDIHTRFGGVVPEIASRNHISAIDNVTAKALADSGLTLKDIDAIAVTQGAGLIGSLLVGISYAKALSFATGIPLIAVNHIEGHIAGNYITHKELTPPFVCLLVSGGHTALVKVDDYNHHELLGSTLDDAVGEAFDKVSRLLGLGYPGGPAVQRMAEGGKDNIEFTRHHADNLGLNFSFSGKKTAVINYLHTLEQRGEKPNPHDVCASFQNWVVDDLTSKAIQACKQTGLNKLVLAGGVSANRALRTRLDALANKENIQVFYPELIYCTDNAAMIGSSAYYLAKQGKPFADTTLAPKPTIDL